MSLGWSGSAAVWLVWSGGGGGRDLSSFSMPFTGIGLYGLDWKGKLHPCLGYCISHNRQRESFGPTSMGSTSL